VPELGGERAFAIGSALPHNGHVITTRGDHDLDRHDRPAGLHEARAVQQSLMGCRGERFKFFLCILGELACTPTIFLEELGR
jgi:hypothetical protein